VQFASVGQVDELAEMVDEHDIDIHAFGLSADFLLTSFPARLGSSPLRTGPMNSLSRRRVGAGKRVAATRE
jgi:hypothetical protein